MGYDEIMASLHPPGEPERSITRPAQRARARSTVPADAALGPLLSGSQIPASPVAAAAYRLAVTWLQSSAGNQAASRQVATLQLLALQRRPTPKPVDPRLTSSPVSTAIAQASVRFPRIADKLSQVRFRAVVRGDRTQVEIEGGGSFVYPSAIAQGQEGFYAFEWDANGDPIVGVNLETGAVPSPIPLVKPLAGGAEVAKLRALRVGVFWITQTAAPESRPKDKTPDQLEVPLDAELSEVDYRKALQKLGRQKLVIPGITGGVFEPGGTYGRPMNFVFETTDGTDALVTRRLIGRDFHYVISVARLQSYLRFYPFEYAGKSAAGWAPIFKLIFDIGLGFVPIIGPLWALGQASYAGYQAYKNWDKMSGFEKGLVGVNILLSVVPVIRAGRNIARGAAAYKEGVSSLISAGLPKQEAGRLMLASGIFQSEKATLQIVDTLGDALRRGERLTAAQLGQLEGVFGKMLQRLPTAERVAIEASFATADLSTARSFMEGMELTEQHLAGLRRLSPEAMVALKEVARKEPAIIQRAAIWAASSEEIANGINDLQLTIKKGSHLAKVIDSAGEDVLRRIGRAGGIPVELATYVGRAKNAAMAYERLMLGSTRLKLPGMNALLTRSETQALSADLSAIRRQFARTYLSPDQLHALSRIAATTRAALAKASDAELRLVARTIDESAQAAGGIDRLAVQLGAATTERLLPRMVSRIGSGLFDAAGRQGVTLSTQLIDGVRKTGSEVEAVEVLLYGFKPRGKPAISGMLDEIAGKIPDVATAEATLAKVELPSLRGDLFARWATRSPAQVRAVSPKLADGIEAISTLRPATAQKHIADLYRAFAGDPKVVNDFLETIGHLYKSQPQILGLDRIVAELAAGGSKSMGASLTLSFAAKRAAVISGFEQEVTSPLGAREYDLVADGFSYEFKYWRGFGGRPASSAAAEFAKDVTLHVSDNFGYLRWVVARDALSALPAIESMMRGVLSRAAVRAELAKLGISAAEAGRRLDAALKGSLITFF